MTRSRFLWPLLPTRHKTAPLRHTLASGARPSITPANDFFDPRGPPMTRLQTTAAALMVLAIATPGCSRNRQLPNRLAPSQVTTLAINSYLWRAAVDTVSFAPLLQANAQNGVIITDWYANPRAPGERVKITVAVLDPDLRSDAIRVSAAKQVYQNGGWVAA